MEKLEQKIIEYMRKSKNKVTKEDIKQNLKLTDHEFELLERALEELQDKCLIYLEDNHYEISRLHAVIHISKDGNGHVTINGKKYFIKHKNLNGALPKDTVEIEPYGKKYYGQTHAVVTKIIKRDSFNEVYKYIGNGYFDLYETNSNLRLYIDKEQCQGLVKGSLVIAKADNTPLKTTDEYVLTSGEIIKTIGHIDDPDIENKVVASKYGFSKEFPKAVMNAVKKLPLSVTEEEIKGRVDLRNENVFTIDGKDTKDIDDALSIKKDGENYILKVSIADVYHYTKDKVLFNNAMTRGNSAYLADSVYPMFPHELSNGICSLNENVNRLALTVEIVIDKNGKVIDSKLYESVIKSRKQMNYDDVNKILEGQIVEGYEPYVKDLLILKELSQILSKNKKDKGTLDFSSREIKIKTNTKGKPTEITDTHQKEAETIIENAMILANICITEQFGFLDYPFIFRVHESPEAKELLNILTKIKEAKICQDKIINDAIRNVSLVVEGKKEKVIPQYLSPLLRSIKDTKYYESVSNLILRSMRLAYYSPVNIGHFGLAEANYSHFTSPIRRAADLHNHKMIKLMLKYYQTLDDKYLLELEEMRSDIKITAMHISNTERLAEDAEREVEEIKRIEYFIDNILDYEGPIEAQIININRAGITILVDNIFPCQIEAQNLFNKGYKYKKESSSFEKGDITYKHGDSVYVFNPFIDKEKRTITYETFSNQKEMFKPKVYKKRRSQKVIIQKN